MKRIISILALSAVVLVAVVALALLTAPYLANTFLIPHLLKSKGITALSVEIQHLTPWRLSGNVDWGNGSAQFLSLPRIELDYSPAGLMRGRLTSLLIDGATFHIDLTNKTSGLRDLCSSSHAAKSNGFKLPSLPFFTDKLSLRHCRIIIERKHLHLIDLTVNGSLSLGFIPLPGGGFTLDTAAGELRTSGAFASGLQIKLNSEKDANHLGLTIVIPRLADLSAFLPGNQSVSGQAKLTAAVAISKNFRSFGQLAALLELPEFVWNAGPVQLESEGSRPLQLQVNGDIRSLHYRLLNLHTSGPHGVDTSFNGDIDPARHSITGDGKLEAKDLSKPVFLSLNGSYLARKTDLTLQIKGDGQDLTAGKERIKIGPFMFTTRLRHDPRKTILDQQVTIETAELPDQQLQLEHIHGQVTLRPPSLLGKLPPPGELAIQKIRFHGQDIAKLAATLIQTANGLNFDGRLSDLLGVKPVLLFHGTASKSLPLNMTYRLPTVKLDRSAFPASLPLPQGAAITGKISSEGSLKITRAGTDGQLKIRLRNGSFDLPKKKIHLKGINCDFLLPHLPAPVSAPSQLLSIGSMDVGSLRFTNGKIYFRLEDTSTLFIEKSRFDWCRGEVETGSMRLSATERKPSTIFYCDRLQFSELLNQFGISGTQGKGSLNGRLPVTLSAKGPVFDDGFLFSTPGNNGIVRFNNTDILRQGITGGKSAVLDYSIQAMQNFTYNWARLTFDSLNGDLLISMQIDGKPASPLPYGYQEGQLVAKKNGPGLQRSLRLDVNFHLPLAKIFSYGQGFQKLMEKIQ